MPEVLREQQSGEMSQRFIAFVLMQAQQITLCLGQMPHPETGRPVTNLEAARLLIDQLEMIREKTRGNLTSEEARILNEVIADMQLAFVRVRTEQDSAPDKASSQAPSEQSQEASPEPDSSREEKKRFRKSYG